MNLHGFDLEYTAIPMKRPDWIYLLYPTGAVPKVSQSLTSRIVEELNLSNKIG